MGAPEGARAPRLVPEEPEMPPAGTREDARILRPQAPPLQLRAEPLLVAAPLAAHLCGLSERTWRKLDATGEVPGALRVGRRRLWSLDELRRWVSAGCPDRERWQRKSTGGTP